MVDADIRRMDLKIHFACNNRCRFCVQGKKRDTAVPISTRKLKKLIMDGQKEFSQIVFTGGEPTIHSDFFKLVETAVGCGYKVIQVQTNARMFANRAFCRQAIEAGVNEVSPALHGHTAELHEYLTRSPGSFAQTITGIANVIEMGLPTLSNTVITRSNFKYLPEIAKILAGLGVGQIQFAFVHAMGAAADNFKSVVPRKSKVIPYVRKALDVGISTGRVCFTEGIPFCFMQGYEEHVAERIIPDMKIIDVDFIIEDFTNFRKEMGKQKGPACPHCRYNDKCEGPWCEYPKTFGWDEFKPVR